MSISDPCPHFPWYAQVPIALYGFVIAATWIDFIADHLVALLEFLGIVARIPNYIMGLTVSDEFLLKISGTYFISFLSYFLCAEYSTLSTYKVLAWGNSMPDLSGNVTMARKGLANMAITACFAGPVFNILVGLGCGFGVLRHATGNENHYVHLTPAIRTGFVFCFVNCGLLLVTGLAINKGKIPSGYGYSAIALYTAYIGTSLLLQFLL
jgi:sodium/potassium/calcium exchanger 6